MMAPLRLPGRADAWHSLFRIGVGAFWLYFAAQKWPAPLGLPPHGISWMLPLMQQAAQVNPLPVLHELLVQVVLPNWSVFAIAEAVGETLAGALILVGLATRPAGLLATLLAINLSLTVAFIDTDVGSRWLYYLPVLASFEIFILGSGALALDRTRLVGGWRRRRL